MCGIAGILALGESRVPITRHRIETMRDAMIHRGPDGAGLWLSDDGRIGLGHRRLSIIDLSAAAGQPMANDEGTLHIVYNGEIYNHRELRRELVALGHRRWRTSHSDTEVVLRAFQEWGIDCLKKLRGMFAFALWDSRARKLWLARDRIGVKPLYYTVGAGRFSFASEIKALLEDPGVPRKLNEVSFFHYLSFRMTPGSDTMFESVRKLPPGTWLCVDETGREQSLRYWDVLDHVTDLGGIPEPDIIDRLQAELRDAVALRKAGDVPLGVFLSGGLDSSLNAVLFADGASEPINTFSLGYSQDYPSAPDELGFARMVAERVGAQQWETLLSCDDLVDFLPRMARALDEPIADPVCVPVYYLSRAARDHGVKVCQLGEGADELFCGYPSWQRSLRLQALDDLPLPRGAKTLGLALLRLTGRRNGFPYEWLHRGARGLPIFWSGAQPMTEVAKNRLLSPRLREAFRRRNSWEAVQPIRDRFNARAPEPSALNWMSYVDLNFRLPELLLMRVDKMSMAAGLEARVPFLDHKFVEFVMSIPSAMKRGDGRLKYLLKTSARDLLPSEIIDRPKQGFSVPTREWGDGALGSFARREIDELCATTDLLDPIGVRHSFERGNDSHIWSLLNFAMWAKEFNVSS